MGSASFIRCSSLVARTHLLEAKDEILQKIPGGSLRGAIEFLEKLHWYFNIKESNGSIMLFLGDRPILDADSMDAVEAFVYGALMAYRSLPEPIFRQYRERMESIKGWHVIFPRMKPL